MAGLGRRAACATTGPSRCSATPTTGCWTRSVEAFAADDGAAVFHAIDHVVEGGHDPRRFAADLLDRLRDLIVLAAVPDAAATGLLDAPADRLEEMAQAGRQLRPGRADQGRRDDQRRAGRDARRDLAPAAARADVRPGAAARRRDSGWRPCWPSGWTAGAQARPASVGAAAASGGRRCGPGAARGSRPPAARRPRASAAAPETPSPAAAATGRREPGHAAAGRRAEATPPRPRGQRVSRPRRPAGRRGGRGGRCPAAGSAPDRRSGPAGHPGAGGQADAGCRRPLARRARGGQGRKRKSPGSCSATPAWSPWPTGC